MRKTAVVLIALFLLVPVFGEAEEKRSLEDRVHELELRAKVAESHRDLLEVMLRVADRHQISERVPLKLTRRWVDEFDRLNEGSEDSAALLAGMRNATKKYRLWEQSYRDQVLKEETLIRSAADELTGQHSRNEAELKAWLERK